MVTSFILAPQDPGHFAQRHEALDEAAHTDGEHDGVEGHPQRRGDLAGAQQVDGVLHEVPAGEQEQRPPPGASSRCGARAQTGRGSRLRNEST